MLLHPDKAALVTMTCVLLHNFLRRSRTSRSLYSPSGTFDTADNGILVEGAWRQNSQSMSSLLPLHKVPRKPSEEAQEIRNEFANYFVNSGRVEWQNKMHEAGGLAFHPLIVYTGMHRDPSFECSYHV